MKKSRGGLVWGIPLLAFEKRPADNPQPWDVPAASLATYRSMQAATHFRDPKVLLEVSEDLAGAMKGLAVSTLDEAHMLQTRVW
jgi:hypothetical protein